MKHIDTHPKSSGSMEWYFSELWDFVKGYDYKLIGKPYGCHPMLKMWLKDESLKEYHTLIENYTRPGIEHEELPFINYVDFTLGNSLGIAEGIAICNPVVIYGVCGFVLYKALEQIIYSAKEFGSKFAPIIFCNAGANGCYSQYGKGHEVKYDKQICDMLDVLLYEPKDADHFEILLQELLQRKNGLYFIRLGRDE